MTNREKLIKLKQELEELEEAIKNESTIQEVPGYKIKWRKTADELMNWEDAKAWCEKQGKGWRLPTKIELLNACENRVSGFAYGVYWSSIENSDTKAWHVSFSSGNSHINHKTDKNYVRCVCDIK